ncbi:molybdenum cofactor biosynthesis prote, partial [Sistotremastrum suecicum HHB10207 ss-3]
MRPLHPPKPCFTPSLALPWRAFPSRSFASAAVHRQAEILDNLINRAKSKIRQVESRNPVSPFLQDSFGRKHDYLRISLTEKCNLRCFYCMPEEGVDLAPKSHILTDDEIFRLAKLFVRSGVSKIRLTGGEPTVRQGILNIVERLSTLRPLGLKAIGMTSNGIALHRKLPQFVANGLTHLNLSLDTLDPHKFEIMTRRPGHQAVLQSLEAALASGLESVKLNVVVINGLNDYEVMDFVEMTKSKDIAVRFIEFMPFSGNKWDKSKIVPSAELLGRVLARHPSTQKISDLGNDTARSYKVPGYKGSFGFISSMSDHFCGTCNRLRVTADGQIKVCLFDGTEVSLRDQMRRGASDDELLHVIGHAVGNKKAKHAGMENIDVLQNRPMILIGAGARSRPRHLHMRHHHSTAAPPPVPSLTHIDGTGRPKIVDVSAKPVSQRSATAVGTIKLNPIAFELLGPAAHPPDRGDVDDNAVGKARSKGDVLLVAQLAAIMASKKTSDLIPLCHPIPINNVSVTFKSDESTCSVSCEATVQCEGRTGVEMEALTSVSVGLLTVWDMLKAVAGKEMSISGIKVVKKSGGRSGDFTR